MKIKRNQQDSTGTWKRVFKVWPVETEDGFTVVFGHVWCVEQDDPFTPVRYHTNPDGMEDNFRREKIMKHVRGNFLPPGTKRPPPPPPPPKPKCKKCGTTDCVPEARYQVSGAGVLHVESKEIAKTCNFRRQLNALRKIKTGKQSNRRTAGSGPR